jgi:hypothetical protein
MKGRVEVHNLQEMKTQDHVSFDSYLIKSNIFKTNLLQRKKFIIIYATKKCSRRSELGFGQ